MKEQSRRSCFTDFAWCPSSLALHRRHEGDDRLLCRRARHAARPRDEGAGLGTGPANRGNPPYERIRHYFFDMGNDSLLAFFEIPKGKEPPGNRNAIGAMQHCAFVVTAERFREVEMRLKSRGIDYIGPIAQLPGLLGIYFYDPNGIRLEFACQPEDGEMPAVIPCITQTKAEARAELESLPGVTPEWIERRLDALPG